MNFNFKRDCNNIFRHTRTAKQRGGCMPYDTGHLAHAAYFKRFYGADECILTINCADNQMGAPYAPILNDGKSHPGCQKHKGFFDGSSENSILGYTINYFVRHYGAEVKNEPK